RGGRGWSGCLTARSPPTAAPPRSSSAIAAPARASFWPASRRPNWPGRGASPTSRTAAPARPGRRCAPWARAPPPAAAPRAARGRGPGEEAPTDPAAPGVEVSGAGKQGAARNRDGQLSYCPYAAFWAERGRALCSELYPGNRQAISGHECAKIADRAIDLLPE